MVPAGGPVHRPSLQPSHKQQERPGLCLPAASVVPLVPQATPILIQMDAPQSQGATFLEEHRSTSFMTLASTPGATHAIESTRASSSTTARSARLQAAVSCPFDGCPYSRQHLSKDTLISHLAARHVSAGQLIPSAVLRMLKHNACPTCRTLHKEGSACQCRGPEQSETRAINTPTAQPTATQDSQHALGVFGMAFTNH